MSQTSSTAFSWSQSQDSQSQSQSQQKPKYGPTGKSQVHSAGYIRDGQVICCCDKPASRRISRTALNPDRPFYCCVNDQCRFWKWEDSLLGTVLNFPQEDQGQGQGHPRDPAPGTNTAVKQEDDSPSLNSSQLRSTGPVSVTTNATNQNQDSFQQSTTPQSNPSPAGAKRSYARMSTGGARPHLQVSPIAIKARHEMTEEERAAAKARRDESIRLALLEHADDGDADEEDEVVRHMEADDAREVHNGLTQARVTDDDESTGPASKKTRFANTIKVEQVDSTNLPTQSQTQAQSQTQTQVPSTPRRSSATFNSQLPTPSLTSGRKATSGGARPTVGANIEADDFYDADGPPSPTSFTKAAQRAKERERLNALDSVVPVLHLSLDKGKTREDRNKTNDDDEGSSTQKNAQNGDGQHTSPRFQASDPGPGPSSRRASQENQSRQEQEHGHGHDGIKTESFALQLASTIVATSSNTGTPTPTRVTHSSPSHQNGSQNANQSSPQSSERHFSTTVNPAPSQFTQLSQASRQDLTQQPSSSFPTSSLSSSLPASPLRSILSEMGAQQTAMQAALSNMVAQQTTLETALHDYMSESEKSKRKVRALEKSVACKDREIGRLRTQVDELRKRNTELEAFQVRFEQFKRTAPGPSFSS